MHASDLPSEGQQQAGIPTFLISFGRWDPPPCHGQPLGTSSPPCGGVPPLPKCRVHLVSFLWGKQKASWVHIFFFFTKAKQAAWVLQKSPREGRRTPGFGGELSPQVGLSPSPAFCHLLFHHRAALKLGQAALSFPHSSPRGAKAARMVPGLVSRGGRLQSPRCHGDRLRGAGDPGEGAARRHGRRIQSSGCRGAGDAERCHLGGAAWASFVPSDSEWL